MAFYGTTKTLNTERICSGGCMKEQEHRRLTPEQVKVIEEIVNRGDRAEVVPVKDGLKILRTRRDEVKPH